MTARPTFFAPGWQGLDGDAQDIFDHAADMLVLATSVPAVAQLMSTCVEDSPERHGGIGCSIIESKPPPKDMSFSAADQTEPYASVAVNPSLP
jgi:hypothetical protein